jgi:hypothetical protein
MKNSRLYISCFLYLYFCFRQWHKIKIIINTDTVPNADIEYFNEYDYYIFLSTSSIPNLSKKPLVPTTPRLRIENIN